ncbi:MAG: glycosyltransferase family 2 protein [Bacteroidota bacterium]|nr:glycosyltransferase family 2 protein [Bacteroidota bacterium]
MQALSVIIVCKNEAAIIGATLESLQGLTDDIVVYDNGSTDGTPDIIRQYKATLHQGPWEGYGKTKQKTTTLAKYDWVLSLDADERMDTDLKAALLNLQLANKKIVYSLRRKNFLGTQAINYGEWGNDRQKRLFNRQEVNWDDAEVHEGLIIPEGVTVEKLDGCILHQTMVDIADYASKTVNYAVLGAEKYFRLGKRSGWVKIRLAPGFTFFKYFFIKLGFLDGHYGYVCARMSAHYTFLKYVLLKERYEQKRSR